VTTLSSELRKKLENTVKEARRVAETASKASIARLGVGAAKAPDYLTPDEQALRRKLRAHGKQLGDERGSAGSQETIRLERECAYEHWHRMLFARFLAENGLLIHPEMQVAVTLAECEEIAKDHGRDAWELAGRYAATMLPAIFRPQDPVLAVPLDPVARHTLENLLAKLSTEAFTADDSLGWVYQFWQADAKDAINDSEVKIGADELPAVTQLFTEPYMVQFLLHNSLGAWWAAKTLTPALLARATNEQELRDAVALPDYSFTYLRFVRDGDLPWCPAAGTFEHWPRTLAGFTALDPCCGSGHFLVALLNLLARLRMADEGMDARLAVDAVIRENLHGLEIDPRCTQIAAFAVALAAWSFPNAGGYRSLPSVQVACCGLRIAARREEWMDLADRVQDAMQRERLRTGMGRLWDVFQQAPVLGSLIDPGQATQQGDIFTAGWVELKPLLQQALSDQRLLDTEEHMEMGVAARGLADAAEYLTSSFDLVATNVPYLGKNLHCAHLAKWCESHYPNSKADLATVFIERISHTLLKHHGISLSVSPQNWMDITTYRQFRKQSLLTQSYLIIGLLGEEAWTHFGKRGPNAALVCTENFKPTDKSTFRVLTALGIDSIEGKCTAIKERRVESVLQIDAFNSPDHRIGVHTTSTHGLLKGECATHQGIKTGDDPRYFFLFFERPFANKGFKFCQGSSSGGKHFDGLSMIVRMTDSGSDIARLQGKKAWGNIGIAVSQMRSLPCCLYIGCAFDSNISPIIPNDHTDTPAIYSFCSSTDYHTSVRSLDRSPKVTNATLIKVAFDRKRWTAKAANDYPNGLPRPYTDDPNQWIFHGHPCGSVLWDSINKMTANGPLRRDKTVLQIALARLAGYQWPAELDLTMELADEQRTMAQKATALSRHADDDGIFCLASVRGEKPAADRLRDLLADAYGPTWSAVVLAELLTAAGHAGMTLENWLRDYAFKEHCDLFQQRPFVWHIWDGAKDGFNAFVNYHRLNRQGLETLAYTYLGDWIATQKRDALQGVPGSELRGSAAVALQAKLEAILTGETPYDIFVRWKTMEQQPNGWEPDLDDGVCLNIRPFLTAEILRSDPKIDYNNDRGKNPKTNPWFSIFKEKRVNNYHTTLAEKQAARSTISTKKGR
jgi:hypothetical protein